MEPPFAVIEPVDTGAVNMDKTDEMRGRLIEAIEGTADLPALEALRVKALGKKGEITSLLKTLGDLSADERRRAGPQFNALKEVVTSAIQERKACRSGKERRCRRLPYPPPGPVKDSNGVYRVKPRF